MADDLKKWRVTGPDGEMDLPFVALDKELALDNAFTYIAENYSPPVTAEILRAAGYRAEPIEEPKMVTVRAKDVEHVLGNLRRATPTVFCCVCDRLRAALDGDK